MTETEKKTVVNSWNEWDPLKHVIVGRAEGAMLQAPEPAVFRDFSKDGFPYGKWGPMPAEMVAKAVEQLNNFVGMDCVLQYADDIIVFRVDGKTIFINDWHGQDR